MAEAAAAVSGPTLADALTAAARQSPGKPAIVGPEGERRWADLARRIARVAHFAHGSGLGTGDIVALVAGPRIDYVEWVAGLSQAGCVVATLAPGSTTRELALIAADCAPRLVLAETDLPAIEADWGSARVIRLGPESEMLLARSADRPASAASSWDAAFCMAYTSGTTGVPKGVLLPHRSRVLTALGAAAEYGCYRPDDRFLALTPPHHGAGLAYMLGALLAGGTVEVERRFEADAAMARLASGAVNGVFVVPTMLARLLEVGVHPAAALRAIICNAMACPQDLKDRTAAAFGPDVLHETYGSTEAGIVLNCRPADGLVTQGSVGRPFPLVMVSLRQPDGTMTPEGEAGELFSRSPYSFLGYHGRPTDTAETLCDGWVGVGDLAVRDAEGRYRIVGRKRDVIISGGINIYPREVEDVILSVPGVQEAAVVGCPDREWGERVHAFIVGGSAEAVASACATSLSPHKRPKSFTAIDTLPRTASGKIEVHKLRAYLGRA